MPTSYLPDLRARLKACAKEAVTSLNSDIAALDYPLMGPTPFLSVQLGPWQKSDPDAFYATEENIAMVRTMYLHIVIDKFTAGYRGEKIQLLDQYEELMIEHFSTYAATQLVSASYPAAATYIAANELDIGQGTGLRFLQMGGTEDTTVIASTHTLTIPLVIRKNEN